MYKRIPALIKKVITKPHRIIPHSRLWFSYFGTTLSKGHAALPISFYITVNNSCNLKCKMCDIGQKETDTSFSRNTGSSNSMMELADWKKLIEEVAYFKPEINIAMTEPLLYPDLLNLINHVKSKGMACVLTTNGILLEKFASELVAHHLDIINISLDGPREIHDRIRGVPGAFDKTIAGINKLNAAKKSFKTQKPKVRIFYTISNYNYSCLNDFLSIVKDNEIDRVAFQLLGFVTTDLARAHNEKYPLYPITHTSVTNLLHEKIDIPLLAKEILKIKSESFNFKVDWLPDIHVESLAAYFNNPFEFVTKKSCLIPWVVAQVNCNGDIVPLTRCVSIIMGNVKRESFGKIWNNHTFRRFRVDLKRAGAFPACTRCCVLSMDK